MKIINPLTILPTAVTTNAAELYSTWSSTVTYSKDQKVILGFRTYSSLINSNLNQPPATSPTAWQDIGPDNKSAAFDTTYSTKTQGNSPLTFAVQPTMIYNSLAVLGLENANTLTVSIVFNSSTVYTKTFSLDGSIVTDWYDYFFNPFDKTSDVVITDLPPYGNGSTINISATGTGIVKVGTVIVGNVTELGSTQYGLNYGIRDYSVKEEDQFGNIVFVKRSYAKRMEPSVFINNTDLRKISNLLTSIRAEPTVFIPSSEDGYDVLITYGYLQDWNIEIPYPSSSLLRLDIRGLT